MWWIIAEAEELPPFLPTLVINGVPSNLVIPVPDSARPAALGYAQELGIPFDDENLDRIIKDIVEKNQEIIKNQKNDSSRWYYDRQEKQSESKKIKQYLI